MVLEHMRMVLEKSRINQNGFRIIAGRPDRLSRSPDILDRNPNHLETYPYGSGTSVNGPERSWKCSRRFRNVPEWLRMVPQGPGRLRKLPKVSGQYHPLGPPPSLGGKPPGLAQVGQEVGRHGGAILHQWWEG